MAVNTMGFNQMATLLNAIVSQATGKSQITPTNTNEFVSVAKVGLETGYDPLLSAISQVLSKTLFSVRPYEAKFKGLMVDSQKFGNHIRKLQIIDKDLEEDDRLKLVDGNSIDQWKVNKPQVLQTNFYGENVVQKSVTIFKDQLDVAFSGPEEFGRFIGMVMQNVTDCLEQSRESAARAALANFIGGKKLCDSTNVVYLLDKYEDETGLTGLTPSIVKQPTYFPAFVKWFYSYIKTQSDLMTERSYKFHKNFTIDGSTKNIARHTPKRNQKFYIYSKELNNMDTSVIADIFHKEDLKLMDHERVNFWQSIDTPMGISVKPGYNDTDGSVVEAPSAVVMSNVFGILFDEEAVGVTQINEWSQPTPMNARGGYYNIYYHMTLRYWNDFTENAVVFVLDHSSNQLGSLSVTPEAGSEAGTVAVTVTGRTLATGEYYAYKLGNTAQSVVYGQSVSDWTSWDGDDEIAATVGQYLTMVVANSSNKAVAYGNEIITEVGE